MALDINHAKQLNYNREFCELEVNQSELTLKVKSLNIFQRILRVLFGTYHTTIWTQKKIDHLADAYPKDTQKIIDLVETLNLYRKSPLSAPRDPKEIQRTIMIVGPSQIHC